MYGIQNAPLGKPGANFCLTSAVPRHVIAGKRQPLCFRYKNSNLCTFLQIFSTMVLTCVTKFVPVTCVLLHRFSADVPPHVNIFVLGPAVINTHTCSGSHELAGPVAGHQLSGNRDVLAQQRLGARAGPGVLSACLVGRNC
jgi:hypothetical protein